MKDNKAMVRVTESAAVKNVCRKKAESLKDESLKDERISFSAVCAITLLVLCTAVLSLSGCTGRDETGKTGNRAANSQPSVDDILQQRIAETDQAEEIISAQEPLAQVVPEEAPSSLVPTVTETEQAPAPTAASSEAEKKAETYPTPTPPERKKPEIIPADSVQVDVDLAAMSGNVVYSEVLNIMMSPQTYVGKSVKMMGFFGYYHDENTGQNYYGCIIQDAMGCCAQGIEFIPTEEYLFPDDFPEEGELVTVAGEFMTYEENGYTYFTLKDAKILSEG
ncbi:MAG: hypothetical protein K5930_06485 [Treponemataceae bacterium]|nr:hypothetical protein [Treponemataceae bacterium]